MGIVFIIFVVLIIFEIYIRRDKFSGNEEENDQSIFTKKYMIILLLLIVILPIIIIFALQTGLLGYDAENIREEYKTNLQIEDKGIFLIDERVKEKIYEKLDKEMDEKITRKELNSIRVINDLKADSLGDLEHFKKLERLEIVWTSDDSLLPIQNLNNLKYLVIENAQNIDNIDPIGNLRKVEYLEIASNQITNISPLENLVNLKELHLNMPQIRDLSPIKKILNLKKLYINEELVKIDEL